MTDAPAIVLRRFQAITDPEVRRGLVRQTLARMEPDALGDFAGHLCRLMPAPEHRAVWLDVALALVQDLDEASERGAAVAARLGHHPFRPVFDFLVTPGDVRRSAGRGGSAPYDLEDVPLGVRKSRARGRSRDVLRQLCDDPDASVVRILLDNPQLIEADVLRIASRRPQTGGTFIEVVRSRRFGLRDAVLSAVVLNPCCPTRLATALTPLLTRPVLREVAGLSVLDDAVRAAAVVLSGEAPG